MERANSAPTLSLQRTSSASSIDSEASSSSTPGKLSRKRLMGYQLMILETLHSTNSLPTREEREVAAREGNMDLKAVTIWFQNKRQAERRTVLRNTTNRVSPTTRATPARSPPVTIHTARLATATTPVPACTPSSTSSLFSFTSLPPHIHTIHNPHPRRLRLRTPSPTRHRPTRPTLDLIASRTERAVPIPVSPRAEVSPWDNMPESPARPPPSPERIRRRRLGGGMRGRTLDWACSAVKRRRRSGSESDGEEVVGASEDADVEEMDIEAVVKTSANPSKVASKATMAHATLSQSTSSSSSRPLMRSRTTSEPESESSVKVDDSPAPKKARISRLSVSSHSELLSSPLTDTIMQPLPSQPTSSTIDPELSTSSTSSKKSTTSSKKSATWKPAITTSKASPLKSTTGRTSPRKSTSTTAAAVTKPSTITPTPARRSSLRKPTLQKSASTSLISSSNPQGFKKARDDVLDDEMMQAAWALCGLGQGARGLARGVVA